MRLLIDDSIELNSTDEKRFASVVESLTWLGKHAPDASPNTPDDGPVTSEKAREAAKLIKEVLTEIKAK